jgi:hypothetical protein
MRRLARAAAAGAARLTRTLPITKNPANPARNTRGTACIMYHLHSERAGARLQRSKATPRHTIPTPMPLIVIARRGKASHACKCTDVTAAHFFSKLQVPMEHSGAMSCSLKVDMEEAAKSLVSGTGHMNPNEENKDTTCIHTETDGVITDGHADHVHRCALANARNNPPRTHPNHRHTLRRSAGRLPAGSLRRCPARSDSRLCTGRTP